MTTINNNEMSAFTTHQREFKTNTGSVFTANENNGRLYTVYSYGKHWALYVYDHLTDIWLANETKYKQPTTNRHFNLARPNTNDMVMLPHDELQKVLDLGGYPEYCAHRVVNNN